MATINYCTLKFPEILLKHIELIQKTPMFNVYRYKVTKGIIFRIPNGVMPDDVCHFFMEHEVNLSNTIKTGTLTLKVQITIVPVHMGVFSGFENLQGSYETDWDDEGDWGYDTFVPDYDRATKKIVPLPIGGRTNLYEYLNEILFKQNEDLDIINQYAVNLGCQKEHLKGKVVFVPAPEYSSKTNPIGSQKAFAQTQLMFDFMANQNMQLLPPANH